MLIPLVANWLLHKFTPSLSCYYFASVTFELEISLVAKFYLMFIFFFTLVTFTW